MTAEPPRRSIVAAAAAGSLVLAGCRGLDALGPPPRPAADVDALNRAMAAEELMVRLHHSALTALAGQPQAVSVVTSVLADHDKHLARLRSRLIVPPGRALPGLRSSPPPSLPAGPRLVIAALESAERAAAARLMAELVGMPPAVAQLMASIGASEAGHAALLGRPGLA